MTPCSRVRLYEHERNALEREIHLKCQMLNRKLSTRELRELIYRFRFEVARKRERQNERAAAKRASRKEQKLSNFVWTRPDAPRSTI